MRKQTRRRVWRLVDPIAHAILGSRPTEKALLDQLRLRELSALEAMRLGKASRTEWNDIVAWLNMSEALCIAGIGREASQACQVAQQHMAEAAARFDRTGAMGLTGPGLQAVRDAWEWHDLQRQSCTRAEYTRCLDYVTRQVQGRSPKVVRL